MSPSNAAQTPNPDVDYAVAKTPEQSKQYAPTTKHSSLGPSAWSSKFWFLGNAAQLLIFVSIFVYVFGHFYYYSAGYSTLSTTIGTWYGVEATTTNAKSSGGAKAAATGHNEMVRPTYFFLFTVLPVAAAAVVFEFLRHYNVRQISSRYVLNTAMMFRRKPSVFGRVSKLSLGELLFVAVLIGGNVYVFQYFYRARYERFSSRGSVDFDGYLNIIGLTFGFVCIFNMAFLFLPATRNCVWMEFLNISYANGVKYHRWLGVITVVTACLHCFFYYWTWIRQGTWVEEALPCFDCSVGDDGKDPWMNFLGLIALIAFVLIGLTSIPWVRRKMYNTFYNVHHLFIIGTIFAVLHWNNVILWILPTLILYVISRSLSSSNGFTPIAVREFTTLGDDIVKITLARATTRAGDFKVGQFVYLNVPALSKLEWHAFTIASSPRSSADSLTILLKSLGDWTEQLIKHTDVCKANNVLPIVYMDAFYGASLAMYDEYSTVCLVGGGIGATPMFAILEDLVAKLSHGEPVSQKVHFVFSFRELALLEEIHPVLTQVKELDPHGQYFSLDFYLTRTPTNAQLDARIDHDRLAGRPHATATRYDTLASKVSPVVFSEPLRSRASRSLMYLVAFVAIIVVLTVLKYGSKVQADNASLWPLQNFIEISLVFVVVALVVYAFVFADRRLRGSSSSDRYSIYGTNGGLQTPTTGKPYVSDVHSFRDLVAEYAVKVGQRPDMASIMSTVLDSNKRFQSMHPSEGNGVVGVFISGPSALKKSTERAMASLGAGHFDVHEEQFEL
jgi:ferric-chelate reductase